MMRLFLMLIGFTLFSTTAFSADIAAADGVGETISFTPSNDVYIEYIDDGNDPAQGYTISGGHKAGDKVYVTGTETTAIWVNDVAGTVFVSGTDPETSYISDYENTLTDWEKM